MTTKPNMPEEIWVGKPYSGSMDACIQFPGKKAAYVKYRRADLATRPPVPEGYALVPIEPTTDMREAGRVTGHWKDLHCNPTKVYKAMIAAAPQPEITKPAMSESSADVDTTCIRDLVWATPA